MIKKTITYDDLEGNPVTEELIFHLSKAELMEMEVEYQPDGYAKHLTKILEAQDLKAIFGEFKNLLLRSYGQKSADGKKLIKSPQARNEFEGSEAYSEILMELATNQELAAEFMTGVLPSGLNANLTQANANIVAAAQAETVDPQLEG